MMNEESLKAWEQDNIEFLTSKEMGEWLYRRDMNARARANKERPQGKWILSSERLPNEMQKVLIWFEYYRYGDYNCMFQTYGFGYVVAGVWSPFINGETGWRDFNIIAWQPLPEPYCGADMRKGGAE